MNSFINSSFENGIKRYLNSQEYGNAYVFEENIIKLLICIFNEADIINPFTLSDKKQLIDNLCTYGLNEMEVLSFLRYLEIYGKWLNSNRKEKNRVFECICRCLIKMIVLKSKYKELTADEMRIYDDFFALSNSNIRLMVEMSSNSPYAMYKYWNVKKKIYLEKHSKLKIMLPKLLKPEVYMKYGLSMEEMKKLSAYDVERINERILSDEKNPQGGGRKKEKPRQLILTSGNGFVDTLVLFSIMVTEIMLGIVILVFLMGR